MYRTVEIDVQFLYPVDNRQERRIRMDCTRCSLKGCRIGRPCTDGSGEYLETYHEEGNQYTARAASALIDNGRAGTLSRLEEIAEFFKLRGYKKLGVAYCYGLEKYVVSLRKYFERQDIHPVFVSCTVDGVRENQVNPEKTECAVSCNPIGQATALRKAGVDFAVLMGLCLGHDILLQKNLDMDFTTFIVKDRVYHHNPLQALREFSDSEA